MLLKFLPVLFGCYALIGTMNCDANAAELIPAITPSFQFNFKDANGRHQITDLTGKATCICNVPLVVEKGALHIGYGAKITIPAKDVPNTSENFTLGA